MRKRNACQRRIMAEVRQTRGVAPVAVEADSSPTEQDVVAKNSRELSGPGETLENIFPGPNFFTKNIWQRRYCQTCGILSADYYLL